MTELKVCLGETYKVPSKYAFHRRKFFHSNTKSATESIEDWFRRIEKSMSDCDFGTLSDFMLIDKFISGLNDETYEQFAVQSTLTTKLCFEIFMAMAFDLPSTNGLVEVKIEPMFSLNEFQEVELIKSEIERDTLRANQQLSEANVCELNSINSHKIDVSMENMNDKPKDSQQTNETKKENASKNKGYEIRGPGQVVCLDCGKSYRHQSSCIVHRRLHTGKNIHRCNICRKPCIKPKELRKHMKVHENDGKSFECYLCSRKFQGLLGQLKRHLRENHVTAAKVNRDVFKCTQCEKIFSTHSGLSLHKKTHQSPCTANLYKCYGCDRAFGRRSLMEKHAIKHSDFRQFVCETCGDGFKTKESLKRHMRKHTDEHPYKCNVCGKMIKWAATLKTHMRSHTGERPFKCDLCAKTFAHYNNLRNHLMVHRDERPHACSLCDKRFVTLHNLNVHMLIHSGQRPYKCNVCEKAFTQAATLRLHTNKRHS